MEQKQNKTKNKQKTKQNKNKKQNSQLHFHFDRKIKQCTPRELFKYDLGREVPKRLEK